jgi:multidrug efflux pump subunit AcrA (membrane-fusion protein)
MAAPRRFLSFAVAFIVILLLGAGIYLQIQKSDASGDEGSGSGAGERPPGSAAETFSTDLAIPVEAAEVVRDTLVISVNAAGQAAALRQATITAQVNGRIERLLVSENERVTPESLLLVVDSTEYALEVARALAGTTTGPAVARGVTLLDLEVDPGAEEEDDDECNGKAEKTSGGSHYPCRF